MNPIVESIAGEFRRYKTLAERAFEQVPDAQLSVAGPAGGNSLAIVCWHVSGNLRSRFTEFLTADGEKPWRHRDEEFEARTVSRADLLAKWEQGWTVLLDTLQNLKDSDLDRTVTIRGQTLRVHDALHRSLAHTAYHVGQIVYLAKALRGDDWTYLSIAPGRSDEFTRQLREGPPSEAEDDAGRRKA